ncbi:hypothetical protein HDV00_009079 [Rhizophlyctis rosea]|nr:hypothetical protein HDV00_009079 [Rhizophlyctis rosea]
MSLWRRMRIRTTESNYRTKICERWKSTNGFCAWGDECNFYHPIPDDLSARLLALEIVDKKKAWTIHRLRTDVEGMKRAVEDQQRVIDSLSDRDRLLSELRRRLLDERERLTVQIMHLEEQIRTSTDETLTRNTPNTTRSAEVLLGEPTAPVIAAVPAIQVVAAVPEPTIEVAPAPEELLTPPIVGQLPEATVEPVSEVGPLPEAPKDVASPSADANEQQNKDAGEVAAAEPTSEEVEGVVPTSQKTYHSTLAAPVSAAQHATPLTEGQAQGASMYNLAGPNPHQSSASLIASFLRPSESIVLDLPQMGMEIGAQIEDQIEAELGFGGFG